MRGTKCLGTAFSGVEMKFFLDLRSCYLAAYTTVTPIIYPEAGIGRLAESAFPTQAAWKFSASA